MDKELYCIGVFELPAHHRRLREERGDSERKLSGHGQGIVSRLSGDIKALNSSILVISQKIKYLVRNEKILGRNLLVLNKKVKGLQSGEGIEIDLSSVENELGEISKKVSSNADAIAELQSDVENIKDNYAKAEDVAEIKYVIDSINPLEFVSVKDVKDLMADKTVAKHNKKKK